MKIAIMGAGAFGTALGGILAFNGYDIDYYDSKVEKEKLSDVLEGAKMVVLCIPSKAVPYLLPYLPKDKPLIVATKGILTDKAFEEFKDFMVLSGPGFASDIKEKKQTALTVTDKRLLEMFKATHIDFDMTSDRKGVLMCGALKNVYAIYAGYLRLEPGAERDKFLSEVAEEMKEVLRENGGEARTVDLACGVGDLKLTCALPSRNYSFGLRLRDFHDSKRHLADTGFAFGNSRPKGGARPPVCLRQFASQGASVTGAAPLMSPRKSGIVLKMPFSNCETIEGLSAIKRIRRREIEIPQGVPILKSVLELIGDNY